jgi:hypothetical protein
MRQVGTALSCQECGTESDHLATGWRAYLARDEDDEAEGEVRMFCPACAEREFGPSGWEMSN